MNKIISSRLAIFKFVAGAASIHVGLTLLSKFVKDNDKNGRLMTIRDYVLSNDIKQNTQINLMGTVRPNSIRYQAGSFKKKFILTDSKYNLQCVQQGISKYELMQGQAIMLKGYCPDTLKKMRIIVKQYSTRHGMQVKQWAPKQNVSQKAYGIQAY